MVRFSRFASPLPSLASLPWGFLASAFAGAWAVVVDIVSPCGNAAIANTADICLVCYGDWFWPVKRLRDRDADVARSVFGSAGAVHDAAVHRVAVCAGGAWPFSAGGAERDGEPRLRPGSAVGHHRRCRALRHRCRD